MKLKTISVENFRNVENQKLEFSPETTLIYGNNAEGKTNIIEAVYMFAHSKSFRRSREKDLIRFGEEEARLTAVFSEKQKDVCFEIKISRKDGKSFYYNGIKLEKMRDFFGHFLAVLFVPEYLKIIKSGPSERRSFLDAALCQIKPGYVSSLFVYHRLCEEKNALLKKYSGSENDKILFEVYNERLAKTAADISSQRLDFLNKISVSAKVHFKNMSGRDTLELQFMPSGLSVIPESFEEYYKDIFKKSQDADLKALRMTTGAQMDDVEIIINSNSARSFASQGQQRSAVVALKLAEGEVVGQITKRSPIYLFDDILSELDEIRREYILKALHNKQVIITSCTKDSEKDVYTYFANNGIYTRL